MNKLLLQESRTRLSILYALDITMIFTMTSTIYIVRVLLPFLPSS